MGVSDSLLSSLTSLSLACCCCCFPFFLQDRNDGKINCYCPLTNPLTSLLPRDLLLVSLLLTDVADASDGISSDVLSVLLHH